MAKDYFGACLCATVTFKITADFTSFYLCHCQYCQKSTGSAHAANVFAKPTAFVWQSGAEDVMHFKLGNSRFERSFCRLCGSAVPTLLNGKLLMVPAGSLDTKLRMRPTAHLFNASKAPWDNELQTLPCFEGFPK